MTATAHIRPAAVCSEGRACATRAPGLGVVAAAPAAGRSYPPAGGTRKETRQG